MTYYESEVLRLSELVYPHKDVTERMVRVKRFMDVHYASSLGVKELATVAAMSRFHFIRLFARYYGRTPHVYLRDVRLGHARRLLRTGMRVKDVCVAVGFESVPSFTRLYRSVTGSRPTKSNFG